ncbi:MAG: hypothetical protein AB8C46_09135, partial [Burkholderiaceae bacterium]
TEFQPTTLQDSDDLPTEFQPTTLQDSEHLPSEFQATELQSLDEFKATQFRETQLHIETAGIDESPNHTIDPMTPDDGAPSPEEFPRHSGLPEKAHDTEPLIDDSLIADEARTEPSLHAPPTTEEVRNHAQEKS